MSRPNVNITLGNGNLGRVQTSDDGVAGLILTGTVVSGKLELNKHYLLGGTADLIKLGVTENNNPLIDKEVKAFYEQAGEGAELHLLVISDATTLTVACAAVESSPLNKLIDAAGGRIRLVGVNKLPSASYKPTLTECIDGDVITAVAAAHATAESQTKKVCPFRVLLPAALWNGDTESLYAPMESTYNRVGVVIASDDKTNKTAAIGRVLGRASKIAVHQSIGRVKDGAIATGGWLTDGTEYQEASSKINLLHDAGYITYLKYPTKNGCYLNGDPMAAPMTDDYSELHLGRVIDKAYTIIYNTYITEIMDNITVSEDGKLSSAVCLYFESLINNAIGVAMGTEISSFSAYVDPSQNVLSSGVLAISGKIVPQGVIKEINFGLSFSNPAIK